MSMGMGELATLAQNDLPITVIVVNNGSLAMEVFEQNALLGNPQFACQLSPVNFAQVAEGCGIRGYPRQEHDHRVPARRERPPRHRPQPARPRGPGHGPVADQLTQYG
jgi:thiamine pyrophosphate-dependent acetolactate synthase large subunit-like protein